MTSRVLCTSPLPEPAPTILAEQAEVTVLGHTPNKAELIGLLSGDFDTICSQVSDQLDAEVIAAASTKLRCISNCAVGFNNIDVAAATARGIVVGNTPDVLTDATADLTLGLIVAAARRFVEGDRLLRKSGFPGWSPDFMLGLELHGALLGILGGGRIGQAVARRAMALGMRIAFAKHGTLRLDPELAGAQVLEFEELLSQADVVSVHVPLNEKTRHLIDERALRLMKPTAILVNSSRGPVVDERALVKALSEKWIFAAGLDVYENEPKLTTGLTELENVVLSPHLGSATAITRSEMARLCAENAVDAMQGKLPRHCVNPQAWKPETP